MSRIPSFCYTGNFCFSRTQANRLGAKQLLIKGFCKFTELLWKGHFPELFVSHCWLTCTGRGQVSKRSRRGTTTERQPLKKRLNATHMVKLMEDLQREVDVKRSFYELQRLVLRF